MDMQAQLETARQERDSALAKAAEAQRRAAADASAAKERLEAMERELEEKSALAEK
jgi:hypothetical protein